MIIVFFHVIYLIGKMMYENYYSAKRKVTDENDEVKPGKLSKKLASDPFAPYPEDNDDGMRAPRFSPPAYIQRYIAVQKVLADPIYKGKIKKVVDFGCSELGFLNHLKNTLGIEEILCIDVDRETLEVHKVKAIPLNADYLQNRPNPLSVQVYEGSVTQRDLKLANCDAVVAIELIEHLYPDTLMEFPYNVFGYIKPLVVAITTPNADFNVLFPKMGDEMRHWDHKFEWTRQQFEDWANNIVSRYPEYRVSFQGIGSGPTGTEHLGCCSQMAVFSRIRESDNLPIYGIEGLFKLVTCQEFPYRVDNRSDEQKILDEASYYIRRFTMNNSECLEEYPLKSLLRHLEKFCISAETLREILENGGYAVVDHAEGAAIVCPELSTFSDYDDELASNENEDIEDDWDAVYDRESSSYRENLGNWGEGNVENIYDECWDDDYEIPGSNIPANEETHDPILPVNNIALEAEFSLTRSLDTGDFNGIEISNVSHVPSILDSIEPEGFSPSLQSFESVGNNTNQSVNIPSTRNVISNQNQNSSVECKTEAVKIFESSSPLNQTKGSATIAQRLEECSIKTDDNMEIDSLCSIYLEASRNEDREVCPENITNPSFDCAALNCTFDESKDSVDAALELQIQKRLSSSSAFSSDVVNQPQFTSSPRSSLESRQSPEAQKSSSLENLADRLNSVSQASLQSNENISTPTTTSSNSSFSTVRKFYPPEENSIYKNIDHVKLKGGNEMFDDPVDEITSESGGISSSESLDSNNVQEELHVTRLARQRAPESLELKCTISSKDARESTIIDTITSTCSKKSPIRDAQSNDISARVQFASYVDSIVHTDPSLVASTHKRHPGKIEDYTRWKLPETSEIVDIKSSSPDAPETPPNSWSPEVMDSGYPNSSSTQDMTPEYDLSSIAQDRISDSESPSVAEAPRLGFLDHADVENGDLANNNRDDEGNNMIAEAENVLDEDLQPLIDVLENDLENENDIYAVENGFPVWLLRILERGNVAGRQVGGELVDHDDHRLVADVNAAGDAGILDLDEGFDSTSSEDDNVDEISTESSEETVDWNASGDYY